MSNAPSSPPKYSNSSPSIESSRGGVATVNSSPIVLPAGAVWIDIIVPLSAVYQEYRALDEPVLVFASGDPLFFGFTTTLMREFPGQVAQTFPSFSSLQMLAHSLRLPYHDMRVVSLTGRPWLELDRALIERAAKVGVLTDKKNTPSTHRSADDRL